MAILVVGKSRCAICNQAIAIGDESISMPILRQLWGGVAEILSDANVHRPCLMASSMRHVVAPARWCWWTELASTFKSVRANDMLIVDRGTSVVLVARKWFLALEEERSFLTFFRQHSRAGVDSRIEATFWHRFECDVGPSPGSVSVSIMDESTGLVVFHGALVREDCRSLQDLLQLVDVE